VLKGVPSGGTGVEELQQDEAIWTLKYKFVKVELQVELQQRILAGRTA